MASRIYNAALEIVEDGFHRTRDGINDAVRSRSYFYPIKGIFHFLTHPDLWNPLRSKLAAYLVLYSGVLASVFFLTYIPQLTVMALVNGPFAVFSAALLVLNESSTITSFISKKYLLQDALLDTFDSTLVARDAAKVVAQGRELETRGQSTQSLGKLLKRPSSSFSTAELIRYAMYLPLNLVPVVGTAAFILLRGRSRGDLVHDRYFQLKAWPASKRSEWLRHHQAQYAAFGTVATLLEMVPLASVLFSFTNAVGAALWAADIEKEIDLGKGTAPRLRETARKAE